MEIDFFVLGIVLVLMHEMDAIRCHEWRILPGLSALGEKMGMILFVVLHVPLFYWILISIRADSEAFDYGFSIFLVVHFVLHVLFLWHKKNEFKDWLSWSIIAGAGACGMIKVILG